MTSVLCLYYHVVQQDQAQAEAPRQVSLITSANQQSGCVASPSPNINLDHDLDLDLDCGLDF